MVQEFSMLKVADNTGAKKLMVIRVLGGCLHRQGSGSSCGDKKE